MRSAQPYDVERLRVVRVVRFHSAATAAKRSVRARTLNEIASELGLANFISSSDDERLARRRSGPALGLLPAILLAHQRRIAAGRLGPPL
jgi:hypothetical protein